MAINFNETPAQTYQRTTGKTWTGGQSPEIQELYRKYGITAPAGSAEANLSLQKSLIGQPPVVNPIPNVSQPQNQPQGVNYQVLNPESLSRYHQGSSTTLPTGEVVLNQGIAPIEGTTKPLKQESDQTELGQTEPTTVRDVNGFDEIFSRFGLNTQTSLSDVVKTISGLYGFDDINKEIETIDNQMADEVMSVNSDPWLSEALRRKKVEQVQNKYESKRNSLVNRLQLQDNVVGRALSLYQQEKANQQDLLLKAIAIRQDELDREAQAQTEEQKSLAEAEKTKGATELSMIKEGYKNISTKEASKLKTQGYDIVQVGDKTYAKPQKLYKVTYKGKTTWYNELGEIVKPSAGQVASQGGGTVSAPKPSTKTAVSEMTQAINSVTGPDGFISPQDHQTLRKQWIDAGLSVGEFDKDFKAYLNPNNPNYITTKQ